MGSFDGSRAFGGYGAATRHRLSGDPRLPPETGIHASIWPLVAYAVFGPSRQLVVGPDAATMAILAAVLSNVLASGTANPGRGEAVENLLSRSGLMNASANNDV